MSAKAPQNLHRILKKIATVYEYDVRASAILAHPRVTAYTLLKHPKIPDQIYRREVHRGSGAEGGLRRTSDPVGLLGVPAAAFGRVGAGPVEESSC